MKRKTKIMLAVGSAFVAFLAVYTAAFVPFGPTEGAPIEKHDDASTALLLVDLQVDFLHEGGKMPVASHQMAPVIETVNRLTEIAPERGIEPVYIVNEFSRWDFISNLFRNGAAVAGSSGAAVDPRVEHAPARVFEKSMPDAFSNEELDAHLRATRTNHLIIAGVFADQCVRATVIGALNRGYEVTVIKDAVAAASDSDLELAYRDLEKDGAKLVTFRELSELL